MKQKGYLYEWLNRCRKNSNRFKIIDLEILYNTHFFILNIQMPVVPIFYGYFAALTLNCCYFCWSLCAPMGIVWSRDAAQSYGALMYRARWADPMQDEGKKSPLEHLRKLSLAWFSEMDAQSNPHTIISTARACGMLPTTWDLELAGLRNYTVPAVTS